MGKHKKNGRHPFVQTGSRVGVRGIKAFSVRQFEEAGAILGQKFKDLFSGQEELDVPDATLDIFLVECPVDQDYAEVSVIDEMKRDVSVQLAHVFQFVRKGDGSRESLLLKDGKKNSFIVRRAIMSWRVDVVWNPEENCWRIEMGEPCLWKHGDQVFVRENKQG